MSRVIFFGCSNTYGTGLPDCWPDLSKPSNMGWPNILANSLNREYVNMAMPSSSNKRIWHTINSFKFKEDDVVIILWSYINRTCILKHPLFKSPGSKDYVNLLPGLINLLDDDTDLSRERNLNENLSTIYYKNFYTYYDSFTMTTLFVRDVNNLLKKNNIKFYQMVPLPHQKLTLDNLDYIPVFHNDYRRKYPRALDNDHMGVEANVAFANDILKHIEIPPVCSIPPKQNFFIKFKNKLRLF